MSSPASATGGGSSQQPAAAVSQLKRYRKIKYLGKGSYGAAILVELRADPSKKYVIKEIIIGHLKQSEQQAAKNEAGVLNQLSHSNITSYEESFVENSKLYIVMEFADGGDLAEAIKSKKELGTRWSEEEIMRIFVQICLALKHVHDTNILHRDLKTQNIFLTCKGIIKLGDFGIAKILDSTDDQANTQIGTPYYLSPEICESQPYGRQSDIWSLGVVLFEIAALEMPFQASSLHALVHKICNYEPDYATKLPNYSANLVNLIKKMLSKDASSRPSLLEIVNSEYIKSHISRLLSHTIKSGTGGVVAAPSTKRNDEDKVDGDLSPAGQYNSNNNNNNNNNNRQSSNNSNRDEGQAKEEIQKLREDGRKQLRSFRDNLVRQKSGENRDNFVVELPPSQYNYNNNDRNSINSNNSYNNNNYSNAGNAGGQQQTTSSVQSVQSVQSSNRSQQHHPTPKSLSEIQQERNRAAAAGGGYNSNYNSNNNNNYGGGGNGGSEANNQQHVVVRAGHSNAGSSSNNNGSEFAKMEFFRNREAAAAVKAKVEAYERNGSFAQPPAGSNNVIGLGGGGGGGNNDDGQSAEERIAMLRERREQEKKKDDAEKQKQLQDAHEANKLYRRDLSTKKALAFEVDINQPNPNNVAANSKVGSSNQRRGIGADGSSLASNQSNAAPSSAANIDNFSRAGPAMNGKKSQLSGAVLTRQSSDGGHIEQQQPAVSKLRSMSVDEADQDNRPGANDNSAKDRNIVETSEASHLNRNNNSSSSSSSSSVSEGPTKKGWNIPVNSSDFQFQVPHVGIVQLAGVEHPLPSRSSSNSSSNNSNRIGPDDRLDKKKVVKEQAREIFRKLKDQKARKQPTSSGSSSPSISVAAQEKQSDNRTGVASDIKGSSAKASASPSSISTAPNTNSNSNLSASRDKDRESPISFDRQRALQGAMSKVEEVKLNVQNLSLNFANKDNSIDKAESKTSGTASNEDHGSNIDGIKRIELKDFKGHSGNIMFPIDECYSDEEELERTLDKWLKYQQSTNIDQRTSEVVDETDSRGRSDSSDSYSSSKPMEEVEEENEDEELLAMQCTLANALIVNEE